MPFLFGKPTIWVRVPLIVAVKRVGVEPKSLSLVCSPGGTCQELMNERSEARSLMMETDSDSGDEHEPPLPVAKNSSPEVSSMVGDPHTPAPIQPLGTVLKIC